MKKNETIQKKIGLTTLRKRMRSREHRQQVLSAGGQWIITEYSDLHWGWITISRHATERNAMEVALLR